MDICESLHTLKANGDVKLPLETDPYIIVKLHTLSYNVKYVVYIIFILSVAGFTPNEGHLVVT